MLHSSNSFDLTVEHQCSKGEYFEDNTNDYLSLDGDCVADPELQGWDFLSDQLDMAITDKTPILDVSLLSPFLFDTDNQPGNLLLLEFFSFNDIPIVSV